MKPKFRSLVAAFAPLSRSSLIVCASLCAAGSGHAAKTWSGATDANWATATNWVEGVIPGVGDTIIFDANSLLNLGINLGANREILGISLVDPAGPVTVSNNALALRDAGINMSTATQDLTINPVVSFYSAQHNLNVATGRTLTLTNVPVRNVGANNDNVGAVLRIGTTGTVKIGTVARAAILDGGQNLNPFITYGDDAWAATDATGTVIAATDAVWTASVGTAFAAGPAAVSASFTQTGNGGYEGITFKDPTTAHTLTFAGSTTFTGRGVLMTSNCIGGTITGGNVRPNRVSTAGATFAIIQNSTLGDLTFGSSIPNASSSTPVSVSKSGPGKVIITSGNGYTGRTFIHGGTLQIGAGGTVGALSATSSNIINNGSLIVDRSNDIALANVISGTGTLTKNSAGTLTLGNANSYTGATTVNSGLVSIGAAASFGATSGITINGGGVLWTAAADISSFPVTIGASGATLNTNGSNVTFANSIGNSGTGSVTKSGAGTLTLSAGNDYSGGTTITAGSLLANNISGSATGSGAVSVTSGASIGGSGTISGTVTLNSGANLAPGASVGTLNVGGLTLSSGSTGTFEFNASPANDAVVVSNSGGLTINGGALTLYQEGTASPFSTVGTYNLIAYTGVIGGAGVSSLSVANPQPGFIYSFGESGGFVTLTIATTGVLSEWGNTGGGSWGVAGNWTNSTVPNVVGATANFFSSIIEPSSVTLDGAKTVGAISFNNGTNAYTIDAGTGGTLTINNGSNPSAISNNDGNHVITVPVTLTTNTSFTTVAADDSTTLSGVVSGAGTVTKIGPGGLSLLGNNLMSGAINLSGGITTFVNGGLGTGSLTISDATLAWNTANNQDISDRSITFGSGPVTFDTNGNDVSLITSAIGGGGSAAFTKAGLGRLTFDEDPTFTGNVTISGGVLQLGVGGTTGVVAGDITNNGGLDVNLADGEILSNLVSGTGSFAHLGSGSLTVTAQNTFSGTTTIGSVSGVLMLTDPLNLQNSTVQLAAVGGSIDFGTLTAATFGGLSGNKNLVLENSTPDALALSVGGNNESTTYGGVLSGAGSLTKLGTGVLTVTGASTYTGNTAVNAGELLLDAGGSLVSTTVSTLADANGFVHVQNGSITAGNMPLGRTSRGLLLEDGSVSVSGVLSGVGSTGVSNSAPIRIYGGTLSAGEIRLGRGGLNDTNEPTGAPVDTNLYVSGGSATISGNLYVGSFDAQPNSSVIARIDGGSLTVGGAISVGLNNGGRWSYVDVNGGSLVSTGTGVNSGLVLGGPFVGKSELLMRAGTATVERIQLGRDALSGMALVNVTGGELYVGSEGIMLGTSLTALNGLVRPVGEDAALIFRYEVRLSGGTLAAKADWSSSLPVNIGSLATSTIKTADAADNPFDITLNGPVTGTGALEKTGGGTLTLTAGNSHGGNTTVLGGTLAVSTSSFNDEATIAVAAADGGTLELNFTGGDLVAGFLIDGNSQPDGIYGSLTNTTPGITQTAAITGNGLLYVNTALPGGSAYDDWATLKGLTVANNGANDDPDFDGFENQLEFALGGDPLSSTAVPPLVNLTVNATDFIFSFNRSDESEAEVTLAFEYGNNLTGWTPVVIGADTAASGPEVSITENAASADAIIVTIPKGVNTKLFGRIKSVK